MKFQPTFKMSSTKDKSFPPDFQVHISTVGANTEICSEIVIILAKILTQTLIFAHQVFSNYLIHLQTLPLLMILCPLPNKDLYAYML